MQIDSENDTQRQLNYGEEYLFSIGVFDSDFEGRSSSSLGLGGMPQLSRSLDGDGILMDLETGYPKEWLIDFD